MKKNILIVQSLLVLPLITSSLALSMDSSSQSNETEKIKEQKNKINQNQDSLVNQLKQHFENKRRNSEPTQDFEAERKNSEPTQAPEFIIEEIITLELPPRGTTKPTIVPTIETTEPQEPTQEQINQLEQSVLLPKESKWLSLGKLIAYKTSSPEQVLANVITELKDSTFDLTNRRSFEILEEAISTAVKNGDIESLVTIDTLCQQNYPKQIRISDETASLAFALRSKHYMTELEVVNTHSSESIKNWNVATLACVRTINEAVIQYNQNVQDINESASIKKQRAQLEKFALLNKTIQPDITNLLKNNNTKLQGSVFTKTMTQTTKELNSITAGLNRIPSIGALEPKKITIETLDQK